MNYFNDETTSATGSQDAESGFSPILLTCAAVLTFAIMVTGIIGNFLTVVVLVKYPKVRNVAAAFIISLCLADLLFCILVLPFSGLRFLQGTWTHGGFLCKFIPFVQYGNIGVSLLCIAMITINRYVMIAHHSLYGKVYEKHWIALMIAFCWLFSYGFQLPTLFGIWGKFGYDPKLSTCSIMEDQHGRSSKTALFVTAFVIPCIIIIACYTKIFWVVHKSEMRLKKHATKQNSIPNNLRPTPLIGNDNSKQISSNSAFDSSLPTDAKPEAPDKPRVVDQREFKAKRNEWRITKMVLAIFLSFVMCYLPITIVKVADKNVDYPSFHVFSYIMLYLSACINPIIYVIMNKQYRKAYKTVILCDNATLLPFRKPVECHRSEEKWRDGLSHNHSRTIASQISTADQLLMGSKLSTTPMQLEPTAAKSTTPMGSLAELHQGTNLSSEKPKSQEIMLSPVLNTDFPQRLKTAVSRTVLMDNDIILEEEEEIQLKSSEPKTVSQTHTQNIKLPSKEIPFYGQNINVILDKEGKYMEKTVLQ